MVLTRRGLRPLLLLDESLGAVAEHYVPRVGKFLSLLATRLNLDILAVSHNPAIVEAATSTAAAAMPTRVSRGSHVPDAVRLAVAVASLSCRAYGGRRGVPPLDEARTLAATLTPLPLPRLHQSVKR